MPDATTQTPAARKKLVKVAPPPAEAQTTEGLQPTRRPLSDSSKKKYDQAIQRLKTAGYDIEKQTKEVIEWIRKQGAGSAQLVYYSAIKYELNKLDKPFPVPREYQDEIDRLAAEKNTKAKSQTLSENQQTNSRRRSSAFRAHAPNWLRCYMIRRPPTCRRTSSDPMPWPSCRIRIGRSSSS